MTMACRVVREIWRWSPEAHAQAEDRANLMDSTGQHQTMGHALLAKGKADSQLNYVRCFDDIISLRRERGSRVLCVKLGCRWRRSWGVLLNNRGPFVGSGQNGAAGGLGYGAGGGGGKSMYYYDGNDQYVNNYAGGNGANRLVYVEW